MKTAIFIGIVLIVFGLAYQGFSNTSRETTLDVAPLEATSETTRTLPVPPIVGGFAVLGGAAILIATLRGRDSAVEEQRAADRSLARARNPRTRPEAEGAER